ncbi:FtsK/SpoIIIE domain-containing protein [Nonomuraea wenchangensis]|uniref:FtsK/SpoIIIE domain-containing protein n=1 Tax=Nonomuraea wenchangensis TaxID=568860 RepID=UPI00384A8C9B
MRIMLTVLGGQGERDVVIDGDDDATVAAIGAALGDPAPLAQVVRLPRSRAPYGAAPGADAMRVPPPRRAEFAAPPVEHEPVVWRDGRPLDPRARAASVLRDGDKVTLDPRLARATVIEEPGGVAEVRVVGGPGAGAVHRLGLGAHVIGADPMCAIAVPDPALAPEAVTVRVTPDAITVERTWRARDEAPKPKLKGRWADEVAELTARVAEREAAEHAAGYTEVPELDGRPLTEPVAWLDQAVLTCGSSVFVLTAVEPKDAHLAPLGEGGVAYNRPPRLRRPEPQRAFVRPKEPSRSEGMRLQLLAAFLPAVLGVTLALALQVWYYLLVALMTPVIMIGQWWSDRRHGKKQHKKALKEHRERLAEYDAAVERARVADEAARRADAPDPAQVLLTATGPRRRLWERRIHDSDALRLRVGLADLPADLQLTEEQGGPLDPPTCRSVPVALPMRRLGVAGVTGPRAFAGGLASWLVAQAATLHSPRDLAIVLISAHPDAEGRWGWLRWLPHCGPRGGEECLALIGVDPESAARRVAELAALIDERQNTKIPELGKIPTGWDDLGGTGADKPAFSSYDVRPYDILVILDGAQVLRGLPHMPQVLRQGPRSGVYTLAIDDDQRLLPEECQTVAACGPDGLVHLRGGGLDVIGPVLGDAVSPAWCDRLARALSPIRDVSRDAPGGDLPDAVRLLDLMGLPSPSGPELAARWRVHGSTQALIGVGPDGPFTVDLRLDGPHGLIAGTTGAGKSELLQTLICALAVANRPDQLTFVLIDYKGGAAFKECVRLPHTVGMVSDLDGHLTQRALDSLAAEIRRRERLLFQAGAKDLDDYAGPVSLPRLVLIIDEFAALVAELPDFVTGLVDIARRGRSLGIHLILATQRPAGVVTADIQANTSLRIALRVTEPAESSDVIDLPDAAQISKNTPGRCYVRSGVGAAVAVQTARVGGRSPALPAAGGAAPAADVRVIDVGWRALGRALPRAPRSEEESAVTDLTLVADALIEAARLTGVPPQPSPWLDPLPTLFVLPLPAPSCGPAPALGGAPAYDASGPLSENAAGASADDGAGTSAHDGAGASTHEDAGTPARDGAGGPVRDAGGAPAPDAADGTPLQASGVPFRGDPLQARARVKGSGQPSFDSSGRPGKANVHPASVTGAPPVSRPGPTPPSGFGSPPATDPTAPAATDPAAPAATTLGTPPAAGPAVSAVADLGAASRVGFRGVEEDVFVEVEPVPFGITDRPWAQDRKPLTLDLAHGGHLLIAGAARSGRSTALRTIAGSIAAHTSPADVHLHAIDCGSGALLPLVAMPHCGAVVTRDQLDRVERLLNRLRAEIGRRQQLLAEAGHASLAEYRQAGHRLPWLVFMMDRWEGFVAAFESYDYGRLIEALLQLLREGPAVGLRAVITSDRSGLLGQVSTVFDDRLLLRLSDSADYGLAGFPLKGLPSSVPPGRALSLGDHGIIEHHIALLSPDPAGPAQVAALQSLARAVPVPLAHDFAAGTGTGAGLGGGGYGRGWAAHAVPSPGGRGGWLWPGQPPLRVDALPMRITVAETFGLDPSFRPPSPLWALVGAGGDALAPLGLDLLAHGPAAVIAGPARSGRSSALLTAARSLIERGTPVIAVTPRRSPLRGLYGLLAVLDGNAGNLAELVAELHDYVVLVDDAELVNADSPLGMALEEVLRSGRDGDHALLVAGTTGDLAVAYRGFVAEARKSRTGVLLAVQGQTDGDLFNIRLPRGTVGGPPGRGFLVTTGTITPIQAALPDIG